jgi:hypothetical protein
MYVCMYLIFSLFLHRILTLLVTMMVLSSIHHSPMMMLITCALLNGAAAYLQITYVRATTFHLIVMYFAKNILTITFIDYFTIFF